MSTRRRLALARRLNRNWKPQIAQTTQNVRKRQAERVSQNALTRLMFSN